MSFQISEAAQLYIKERDKNYVRSDKPKYCIGEMANGWCGFGNRNEGFFPIKEVMERGHEEPLYHVGGAWFLERNIYPDPTK